MIHPKRPFLVTLLALGVLTLTIFNAIRFGTALAQWDFLLARMPVPGPFYIAATGLLWTLGLLIAALSLWFGWKWARPTAALMLSLYTLYYWLDRIFYQMAVARENQGFALIVSFISLLFTAVVLLSRGSQKFFNR